MTSPVWHPFTQHGLEEPIPCVVRGDGAALFTADGRRVIDAISSWWVTTHGHNHSRIVAAIREQAARLDQVIFAGWTHEPAETVARALTELLPPELAHVFFSDSGSTAVEVALKMALGFWLHTGRPRHKLVVMEHGYHGDTVGTMSVGERGVFNQAYAPLLFEVERLPFPAAGREDAAIAAFRQLARAPDPPAALLLEPLVLGAGGMLFYPAWVLAELRAVAAAHDILFIADEVMTGWGRTGTLTACEQAGVVPDILCLSKGLTGGAVPLAVTMATRAIFDAHRSRDRSTMLFHSSSYTANPLACAAAAANLAIWQDEPVLDRVLALGRRQEEALARLAARRPILNPRRLGTIAAFEVDRPAGDYLSAIGPRLLAHYRAADLLLRPLGNTVYVMPPYCIAEADLDRVYAVIEHSLEVV